MIHMILFFIGGIGVICFFLYLLFKAYETKNASKQTVKMEKEGTVPNRRQRFRLSIFDTKCNYSVATLGVNAYGSIVDISSNGMKLHTFRNFPIEENVTMDLQFELEGKQHELKGKPVRKFKHNDYRYEYGIEFQHDNQDSQEELFQSIWKESRKRMTI